MLETILIGIITPLVLWFLKTILVVPILRVLKNAYAAVANKHRKSKVKVVSTSYQHNESRKSEKKVEDDAHQYNENYRKRHGQLKISGFERQAPISLDDISVAVQFLYEEEVAKYSRLKVSKENFEKRVRTSLD